MTPSPCFWSRARHTEAGTGNMVPFPKCAACPKEFDTFKPVPAPYDECFLSMEQAERIERVDDAARRFQSEAPKPEPDVYRCSL